MLTFSQISNMKIVQQTDANPTKMLRLTLRTQGSFPLYSSVSSKAKPKETTLRNHFMYSTRRERAYPYARVHI